MTRPRLARRLALTVAVGTALVSAPAALANHPVLVEGNCNNAADPMFSPVPAPGTCGDYDGDGRIGSAEDGDGDRVFGTINGGNSSAGAANNGTITVVTSGLFAETVTLTGNVTLEAAPGVEANVDAVRQGDPRSTARQAAPGIIVDAPPNRQVIIRNIQSRNWTTGFEIRGGSRVALEGVRAEHNINYGIEVNGAASVSISNSEIHSTGRRVNPMSGDFPSMANQPAPGTGIEFDGRSIGVVFSTRVTGSTGIGIDAEKNDVCLALVTVFDNARGNLRGGKTSNDGSCIGSKNNRGPRR
ncbi:MAG TPA: right-handed parallel beta-helix repeat-containing protein [Gaiellaceae bacterium]|nr:right-handed parallel beta-helix repeat-containing protein [Gaiellaceae bacterium]